MPVKKRKKIKNWQQQTRLISLKLGLLQPYVAEFCWWGWGGLFCTPTNEIDVAWLRAVNCLLPAQTCCFQICLRLQTGPARTSLTRCNLLYWLFLFLWQHNDSLCRDVAEEKVLCCDVASPPPSFLPALLNGAVKWNLYSFLQQLRNCKMHAAKSV